MRRCAAKFISGILVSAGLAVGGAGFAAVPNSDQPSASDTGQTLPKLHPLEAFCVDYELSGIQTGTLTECIRNYGYERVEKRDIRVGTGDQARRQREQMIYQGPDLISINLDTGKGVKITNPEYETVAALMAGPDPVDIVEIFARALGGEQTGEKRVIAGKACAEWISSQGGQETVWCMSADGLVLDFTMQNFTKRAVRVRMGDGGPDTDYQVGAGILLEDATGTAPEDAPFAPVQ